MSLINSCSNRVSVQTVQSDNLQNHHREAISTPQRNQRTQIRTLSLMLLYKVSENHRRMIDFLNNKGIDRGVIEMISLTHEGFAIISVKMTSLIESIVSCVAGLFGTFAVYLTFGQVECINRFTDHCIDYQFRASNVLLGYYFPIHHRRAPNQNTQHPANVNFLAP